MEPGIEHVGCIGMHRLPVVQGVPMTFGGRIAQPLDLPVLSHAIHGWGTAEADDAAKPKYLREMEKFKSQSCSGDTKHDRPLVK